MTTFSCHYPGCDFTHAKEQYLKLHMDAAGTHCYPGLLFRLTCSAKNGCQKQFFTRAFIKEDVENYLDPEKPKSILCIACREKQRKQKEKTGKRKRKPEECIIKRLIKFSKPCTNGDDFLAGVTREEVLEYFEGKSQKELDKYSTENCRMANSLVSLAKIYTESEDGGGAGVHGSVRRFWYDLINYSRCFSRANPSSHNGFFSAFAQFRLLYDRYKGAPTEFQVFMEQSLKIKRMGKPLLGKRGEDHYVLLVHAF